ncbi:hypothetical protein IEN91_05125 [Bacillus velezensis]|uniref:hypothetical protein n=1 Tax=Bacillus velezensis TaxID=492670 RepID=UPI0018C70691|nr:hypothetical protein [Bacillus velezensis]QPK89821.1 hypothetical protein IEN91_05125 [Bacillus velezensis]
MKTIIVTKRVKGQLDKLIQEKRKDYPPNTLTATLNAAIASDLYEEKSIIQGITIEEAVKCLLVGYRTETNEEMFLNKIKEREDCLERMIAHRKEKGHFAIANDYAAELCGLHVAREYFKDIYSINE